MLGIRESRSGSFALRGRLFYMEDDVLCKFYDALRKLCEKLHANVQLSGILVPLSRRRYGKGASRESSEKVGGRKEEVFFSLHF